MRYAGIGSRETPPKTLDLMYRIAAYLAFLGWVLRTGGAKGADQAFMDGCPKGLAEIFLPWASYEQEYPFKNGWYINPGYVSQDMLALAEKYHPAWHRCSQGARKLHARNVPIILGPQLDQPVDVVICYTPRGSGSGGTGQAIRVALDYGIPVYDLGDTHLDVRELMLKLRTFKLENV